MVFCPAGAIKLLKITFGMKLNSKLTLLLIFPIKMDTKFAQFTDMRGTREVIWM